MQQKIGVWATGEEGRRRRTLKDAKVLVYGTEVYALMDSGAILNVLPRIW